MLGLVRAAPRQLEHVVGGLGLAPRAELARVLRRDRRAISVVLDLRHQTDRFAVGAVRGRALSERVVRGADDAERARTLAIVVDLREAEKES